jgi:hypothetical protein
MFSCEPREHTTADLNCPHARIGGCNVVLASTLSIHLFAIADLHNENDSVLVIDGIYDSVIALSNPILILIASQFFRSRRTRINGQ